MDRCTFPEEVSLFEKPCSNIAYQKIQYVDYRPTSLLSNSGSLNFTIPPTGSQYINLKKTYLHLKAKIVNADGSAAGAKMVAPINLTLHSLFNQVDVQLQQQLVSSTGSQTYGYKAYIETLLDYGHEAKNTQLQAQCFYKDKAGRMDFIGRDPDEEGHQVPDDDGMTIRLFRFLSGRTAELIGPLMVDICQQDRLILNGVEIQVKLWPSKDAFHMMSSEENPAFKMEITEATLKVCKVTPTPTLLVAHSAALKENNALYPYLKTQLKTFNVPSGQYNFLLDDLYQGQIPSHLVIAMVKSKGFTGDYTLNPYNLEMFKINSLAVYLNDESMPGKPLQLNTEGGLADLYSAAYYSMFTALNRDGENWGNDINLFEFGHGYGLFVFDLLPGEQPALQKANVRIEGAFSEVLAENITIIVYGKFPAMLEITSARSVLI